MKPVLNGTMFSSLESLLSLHSSSVGPSSECTNYTWTISRASGLNDQCNDHRLPQTTEFKCAQNRCNVLLLFDRSWCLRLRLWCSWSRTPQPMRAVLAILHPKTLVKLQPKAFSWNYQTEFDPDHQCHFQEYFLPLDWHKHVDPATDQLKLFCEVNISDAKHERYSPFHARQLDRLSSALHQLLISESMSDYTVVVGDRCFAVHRIVLAIRSPVFAALFDNTDAKQHALGGQLVIEDTEPEVFEAFLEFVYTGLLKPTVLDHLAAGLLALADEFGLDELKLQCELSLMTDLKVAQAAEMLLFSDRHNLVQLKHRCVKVINQHKDEVIQTQGWTTLMDTKRMDLMVELWKCNSETEGESNFRLVQQ